MYPDELIKVPGLIDFLDSYKDMLIQKGQSQPRLSIAAKASEPDRAAIHGQPTQAKSSPSQDKDKEVRQSAVEKVPANQTNGDAFDVDKRAIESSVTERQPRRQSISKSAPEEHPPSMSQPHLESHPHIPHPQLYSHDRSTVERFPWLNAPTAIPRYAGLVPQLGFRPIATSYGPTSIGQTRMVGRQRAQFEKQVQFPDTITQQTQTTSLRSERSIVDARHRTSLASSMIAQQRWQATAPSAAGTDAVNWKQQSSMGNESSDKNNNTIEAMQSIDIDYHRQPSYSEDDPHCDQSSQSENGNDSIAVDPLTLPSAEELILRVNRLSSEPSSHLRRSISESEMQPSDSQLSICVPPAPPPPTGSVVCSHSQILFKSNESLIVEQDASDEDRHRRVGRHHEEDDGDDDEDEEGEDDSSSTAVVYKNIIINLRASSAELSSSGPNEFGDIASAVGIGSGRRSGPMATIRGPSGRQFSESDTFVSLSRSEPNSGRQSRSEKHIF